MDLLRIIIKWLFWAVADTAVMLLALILSPLTSLFVDRHGNLKYGRQWLQTPDSNMWGDPGDMGFYEDHVTDACWWTALCWQWRNTAQGFSTWVLGLDERDLDISTVWESGEGDLVKYLKLGRTASGKLAGFEFKGALQWFGLPYRFRWRLGWKFGWDSRFPAQFVFSLSPFMRLK